MGFVKQIEAVDVSQTPNYITAKALATHPDVSYPNAPEIAFSIQIDVTLEFTKDPDFPSVIDAYVHTLNNVYATLSRDFPGEAKAIFANMAKTMTLKYDM